MIFWPMALKNSRGPTVPLLPPLLSPSSFSYKKMTSTSELKLSSPPPNLPMPKTTKRLALSDPGKISCAEVFFNFGAAKAISGIERRVGQGGQLAYRLFHRHRRHQIARADAQVLALLVPAQGSAEFVEGFNFLRMRRQFFEVIGKPFLSDFDLAAK